MNRFKSTDQSFNSLQTGNHIQSRTLPCPNLFHRVSIPFKRENIYKATTTAPTTTTTVSIPFKRETIYKGYAGWRVSRGKSEFQIPFKRESISKAMEICPTRPTKHMCFNSLQTGNHIQRQFDALVPEDTKVVFQFPSNGKPYPKSKARKFGPLFCDGFNSLQTGKHIQSEDGLKIRKFLTEFQFPSNGKAYPKSFRTTQFRGLYFVSIPFKRESISKDHPNHNQGKHGDYRFNSLQTGKHIQRCWHSAVAQSYWCGVSIPFKRETIYKDQITGTGQQGQLSFNSLQTGKHIQRNIR